MFTRKFESTRGL